MLQAKTFNINSISIFIISIIMISFIKTTQATRCTNCLDVRGIISNLSMPIGKSKAMEYSNIKVTLYPFNIIKTPNQNGEFIFYDIPPGIYRLEVFSLNNYFEPTFFEISGRTSVKSDIFAFSYNPQLKRKQPLQYPLVLSSQGKTQYFEIKEEFTLIGMIKSPYGIMIAVSVVMLWLVKKMPSMEEMANADQPGSSSQKTLLFLKIYLSNKEKNDGYTQQNLIYHMKEYVIIPSTIDIVLLQS